MVRSQGGLARRIVAARRGWGARYALRCAISLLLTGIAGSSALAGGPLDLFASRPNPGKADTSKEARLSAVQSIPIERLDPEARAKVAAVLSDVTIFRRMPIRVVDCDPHFYLFLVRHPDIVTGIWEELKLSKMKVRETGSGIYRLSEPSGTYANAQYLYRTHDTHIIYAEGSYIGPLLARETKGRCLMILKSGYVREPDGRYYITNRLDAFLQVDSAGAELVAKALQPLMGKTVDNNFAQSVAFLGSLSRTAEVNSSGVGRLATKLSHVKPELRAELAELATKVAKKSAENRRPPSADLVSRPVIKQAE